MGGRGGGRSETGGWPETSRRHHGGRNRYPPPHRQHPAVGHRAGPHSLSRSTRSDPGAAAESLPQSHPGGTTANVHPSTPDSLATSPASNPDLSPAHGGDRRGRGQRPPGSEADRKGARQEPAKRGHPSFPALRDRPLR